MEVKSCKVCKKLFNYIGGPPICPKCREELEEKFMEVKEYINDNKTASIGDISKDNEVPIQQIKQWIREERLIFAEDSPIMLECEKCGAKIRTGRYCERCKSDMIKGINEFTVKKKEEPKISTEKKGHDKMRFLDK